MNPELEKTPGLPFPQPATEMGRPNFGNQQPGTVNPEFLPVGSELQPGQPGAGTLISTSPIAVPANDQGSGMGHPGAMQPSGSNAVPDADDSDMDELWINKAKEIVDKTRSDPHMQSRALGKLKAEFLKNRYNKEIKVIED